MACGKLGRASDVELITHPSKIIKTPNLKSHYKYRLGRE